MQAAPCAWPGVFGFFRSLRGVCECMSVVGFSSLRVQECAALERLPLRFLPATALLRCLLFFPFELWSGCSSFFLPDLSFWQLASSRSGVCSVFLLRPRPTVAGGVRVRRGCVSGAEPTSVRGSVYLGPFWDKTSPSPHLAQQPCSACARRGAPVFGGRSWKVPELLGSSFWTVLGRVWICSVDC